MLSDEKRRYVVKQLISYFKTERDEDIGVIAAEQMLDFFLKTLGTELYNKGIEDTTRFIVERFESLEVDLGALKK